MLSPLKKLFSPNKAHDAYMAIVAQSRSPVFYQRLGVPDTIDGRFDLIVLHLVLVMHSLSGQKNAEAFLRSIAEIFFADMDRSLREMGVGDMGVARRVKAMVEAFYGRLKSYEESLGNPAALQESLKRNLYRAAAPDAETLAAMAEYTLRNAAHLRGQKSDALLNGEVEFLA